MKEPAVIIERDKHNPNIYWLREEPEKLAFAYVERVANGCWWLGGQPASAGYFSTRNKAIAAAL